MSPRRSALLAATLMFGAVGFAEIQQAQAQRAPTYDPAQLPEVKGKIAQYTINPRGDVDGFMLEDGTEVHTPPPDSTQIVFAVRPGDAVTIHGLKAKVLPMVAAASVTNDATGVTVSIHPGRHMWGPGAETEVEGVVKAVLHEPRGEANGVLLADGTVVRMPPPEAAKLTGTLVVGKAIFVRGNGNVSPLGKVIVARQIGPDRNTLTTIAAPQPRDFHGMPGRRPPPAPQE